MSKTISVTDLKLIDKLSHLNYIELVSSENDYLVHPYLDMIGIDLNKPLEYRAYQHRNMQGAVVINFMIAGELKLDRASLTSKFSTFEDRLIAASMYDQSLFTALHDMGHNSPSYGSDGALDEHIPAREKAEYAEEEARIKSQIDQLEAILFLARGEQRKDDGSFKTAWDYKNPSLVVEKKRKKRKQKEEDTND